MRNYTELFEEFLDLTEFTLVRHQNDWSLVDRQGANLGDIESDRFDNATQILNRMEIYINDYILRALEDELDMYKVDFNGYELPWGAETWLALRDNKKFYLKNLDFFKDHTWEFDVLDMIAFHSDEIDLKECFYEEVE